MYDVVVVGSGGGALTGAALAAKAGLSTVVVEKTPLIGGTSAYSGGACWLPGSDVQQRAGIPDSTESARTYLDAILRVYNRYGRRDNAYKARTPLVNLVGEHAVTHKPLGAPLASDIESIARPVSHWLATTRGARSAATDTAAAVAAARSRG